MLRRGKVWLILGGLAAGVAGKEGPSSLGGEEPPAKPTLRVLFPADRSVVETGQFELMAVQPKEEVPAGPPPLQVDGAAYLWEHYRAPVLVARLKLSPGPHQLQIGPRTVNIFVRGDSAPELPEGWPVLRQHPRPAPGDKGCPSCHEVKKEDSGITVSVPQTPAACDRCHADSPFEVTHFHPKAPLAPCQMCHALHGSTRPNLLKKPIKELCAACHE